MRWKDLKYVNQSTTFAGFSSELFVKCIFHNLSRFVTTGLYTFCTISSYFLQTDQYIAKITCISIDCSVFLHLSGPDGHCLCSPCSLIEFFNKMKKWQDMANLAQDFRQSTDKLERNFTVSAVIFKKYVPIFRSIFKTPSEEPQRVHRSRKQRWDITSCDFNRDFLGGPFLMPC